MNNAEMEKFFFAVYPKKTFNSIKKDNYDLVCFLSCFYWYSLIFLYSNWKKKTIYFFLGNIWKTKRSSTSWKFSSLWGLFRSH